MAVIATANGILDEEAALLVVVVVLRGVTSGVSKSMF